MREYVYTVVERKKDIHVPVFIYTRQEYLFLYKCMYTLNCVFIPVLKVAVKIIKIRRVFIHALKVAIKIRLAMMDVL